MNQISPEPFRAVRKLPLLPMAWGWLPVLCVGAAFAQPVLPDAGSLALPAKEAPSIPAVPQSAIDVPAQTRAALVAPGGLRVKVKSFRVTGNSVFSAQELDALLAGFVGQELDLAGLDLAAASISKFYRQKGFFVARAYLPAQQVASGNIEIAVIEGRLGAVSIQRDSSVRLNAGVAKTYIDSASASGTPINEAGLERGLMLLGDLPGMQVKSTLIPGTIPGTSDLVVETSQSKLLGASVDVDNYGNIFTGEIRAGASLNLDDISGNGDLLTVRGLSSGSGLNYGRVAYFSPLGSVGTKLGLAGSVLRYSLGKDFAALNAKGTSNVLSLIAVHPVLRSRNANFYATLSYDKKKLKDQQLGINTSDKSVDLLTLGVSGDARDSLGGGGFNAGSLSLSSGKLAVDGNAGYAANDGLSARTAGSYNKLGFNATRLQRVTDSTSLYASVSGQSSQRNLDSSEKFTLGGSGVRAYPQGEASGDTGALLNIEARYNLPTTLGTLQLLGFIDTGRVTLHKNTWAGWQPSGQPGFPNSYSLSGIGVGLNLFKEADYFLRASLAWKVGSNPGADA